MPEAHFTLFGLSHLIVLFILFFFAILLPWTGRRKPHHDKKISWILAIIIIFNRLWTLYYAWSHHLLAWENGLPLQLCDVVAFMTVWCLLVNSPKVAECVYFWVLSGTTQAILTPDLPNFPDPRFTTFFIAHCGLVIAAVY